MAHDLKLVTKERKSRMFEFTYPGPLTEQEACEIQMQLGYHPAGYGFYGFKSTPLLTQWSCGDSCD